MPRPSIAVVLPTRDRAIRLDRCLTSLAAQTIEKGSYEVIAVDDGSRDETWDVLTEWQQRLPLRSFRQAPSGASAARNLGLFASIAPIVLFHDDDEVAAPDLLEQHLLAHARRPSPTQAVLGYTTWAPGLEISHFMHFVTEVGRFLFSYPDLTPESPLEFHHFWTGRISLKRHFLVHHGTFSPRLRRLEDIELGFRLARHGLEIHYTPSARNYIPDPLTFDEFCHRSERDGAALVDLLALYPNDPTIRSYCTVSGAESRWRKASASLDYNLRELRALEQEVRTLPLASTAPAAKRLRDLYGSLILTYRDRGILGALGQLA
jgi:glycosyltransferase involved in cell wall biosynthesis